MRKNISIWEHENAPYTQNPLKGNITADAAVIGGGMAGVLTAYKLQKRGLKVVLIERDRIGSGVTKHTTAKITAQHKLIYHRLLSEFGITIAKQYARSNLAAIEEYADIIQELGIECDFERKTAYVYTNCDRDIIRREMNAALLCGIDTFYTEKSHELPFKVKAMCGFKNQAQFDPLKFLNAVAKTLKVYDKTTALDLQPGKIITDRGTVTADHIAVCTHYPFYNGAGLYFTRLHQQTSYAIAVKPAKPLGGMYISADANGFSFRSAGEYMLLGGASHRTGEHKNRCYDKLFHAAKLYYPHANVSRFWSAQDCISIDGLPYIGRYSPNFPRLYAATGFQKWGMTLSMVSADVISDLIMTGRSEYERAYDPARLNLSASSSGIRSNVTVISKSIFNRFLRPAERVVSDLKRGEGGIVRYHNQKMGVYRDSDGRLYAVSAKCPHLGCELRFNSDDKTWDCPCHGSRFDIHGRLLNNPANTDLDGKKL